MHPLVPCDGMTHSFAVLRVSNPSSVVRLPVFRVSDFDMTMTPLPSSVIAWLSRYMLYYACCFVAMPVMRHCANLLLNMRIRQRNETRRALRARVETQGGSR